MWLSGKQFLDTAVGYEYTLYPCIVSPFVSGYLKSSRPIFEEICIKTFYYNSIAAQGLKNILGLVRVSDLVEP